MSPASVLVACRTLKGMWRGLLPLRCHGKVGIEYTFSLDRLFNGSVKQPSCPGLGCGLYAINSWVTPRE